MRFLLAALLVSTGSLAFAQNAAEIGRFANSVTIEGTTCSIPPYVGSDDGTAENGYSGNAATVTEFTVVDRFSTADFPGLAIDSVCIGFVSLGTPAVDYEIVVFDDDGAGGAPGTLLGAVAASATGIPTGLPETLFQVDFTGAGVTLPTTGDFYLGVRYAPFATGNVFVASDETGATNAGAGFLFFNTGDPGDAWEPINGAFPGYSGMFIRGLPGAAESQPVPAMGTIGLALLGLMLIGVAIVALRARG